MRKWLKWQRPACSPRQSALFLSFPQALPHPTATSFLGAFWLTLNQEGRGCTQTLCTSHFDWCLGMDTYTPCGLSNNFSDLLAKQLQSHRYQRTCWTQTQVWFSNWHWLSTSYREAVPSNLHLCKLTTTAHRKKPGHQENSSVHEQGTQDILELKS